MTRPKTAHGKPDMRIPNSPLFKRYELYLMLALAVGFICFASLNVVL